jgi:hypothetical protein
MILTPCFNPTLHYILVGGLIEALAELRIVAGIPIVLILRYIFLRKATENTQDERVLKFYYRSSRYETIFCSARPECFCLQKSIEGSVI